MCIWHKKQCNKVNKITTTDERKAATCYLTPTHTIITDSTVLHNNISMPWKSYQRLSYKLTNIQFSWLNSVGSVTATAVTELKNPNTFTSSQVLFRRPTFRLNQAKASTRLYFLKQLKRAGLAADQLHHFYLSAIRPILEYCSVVWHHGLTKTQVEQLQAIQRRAIRIIFEVTFNMLHQFAMAYANISSLHACREDLNNKFFRKILNNPDNPVSDLLPASRDAAIIGRLRSAHLLPVLRTHTSKYRSFIHHGLIHYQPKLKWIISLLNHIVLVTKTVHFVLWYYCWHCFY